MSELTTFCDENNNTVGFAVAAYVQTIDPVTCATSYSLVSEYYDTDFVSVGTSLPAGWQKCCCGSGGGTGFDTKVDSFTYDSMTGNLVLTQNDFSTFTVNIPPGSTETITTLVNTIAGHLIGTYTSEDATVVDINETVTSLAYNAGTNILSFTDETGTVTDVDLTALAVDINVASLAYNPVTGEITLTETDSTTHVIDIGPFAETTFTANDSSTIDFTTSGTSNHTLTGVVKVSATAGNQLSTNADGLYVAENDNQTLSLSGNSLTIAGGNTVVLPADVVTTVTNTITGHKIADYTNESGAVVAIDETVTALGTPTLAGNILTIPYTDENGVVNNRTVNLSALAIDINVASLSYNPVTGEITLTETDSTTHVIDIGPPISQFTVAGTSGSPETIDGGDTLTLSTDQPSLLDFNVQPTDTVKLNIIGGNFGEVLTTDPITGDVVWLPAGGAETALTDAWGFRPTEHTRTDTAIVAQWLGGIGQINASTHQIMGGDATSRTDGNFTDVFGSDNQITNGWSSYSGILSGFANRLNGSRYSVVAGGIGNNIVNSNAMGYNVISGGAYNTENQFGGVDFATIGGGYQNDISNAGAGTVAGGQEGAVGSATYSGNWGSVVGGYRARSAYGGVAGGYDTISRGDYSVTFGRNNVNQKNVSAVFGQNHQILTTDPTTNGGMIIAGSNHSTDHTSTGMAVFGGGSTVTNGRGGLVAGNTHTHSGFTSVTLGDGNTTTGDWAFNFGSLNTNNGDYSYILASQGAIVAGVEGAGIFAGYGNDVSGTSDGAVVIGGYQNIANDSKHSIVQGWSSETYGFNNIALGNAYVSGVGGVAIGGKNDTGPAPGIKVTATGDYAVALGVGSQATAPRSFAANGGVTSSGTTGEVAFGGNMSTAIGFRGVTPVAATTVPVAATASFADVDTALNLLRAVLIGQGLAQ